jgi:hypothetical protein
MTKRNQKGGKGDTRWIQSLRECGPFLYTCLGGCLTYLSGINRLTRNFEHAIPVVDDAIRSGFLFKAQADLVAEPITE